MTASTRSTSTEVRSAVAQRSRPRQQIMGVEFDNLTADETSKEIVTRLSHKQGGTLVNPNVDVLRLSLGSEEVRELVSSADLVLVDGAPIYWASLIARRSLKERVPGANFLRQLCAEAASNGLSVYLLGGREGAVDVAARTLVEELPDLKLVGTSCPPFGFHDDIGQMKRISDDLRATRPDIVFCAFGFPKQELVMSQLSPAHPQRWFIGTGASVDFVAGMVKRAPAWMQAVGVEWVYRLYQEPRRLFRRYIVHDIPFATRLGLWALRTRRGR